MASNLPPGCSLGDIERAFGTEGPCDVCKKATGDCICPECPLCQEQGNLTCYDEHGLKFSREQRISQAEYRICELEEMLDSARYYLDWIQQEA